MDCWHRHRTKSVFLLNYFLSRETRKHPGSFPPPPLQLENNMEQRMGVSHISPPRARPTARFPPPRGRGVPQKDDYRMANLQKNPRALIALDSYRPPPHTGIEIPRQVTAIWRGYSILWWVHQRYTTIHIPAIQRCLSCPVRHSMS